MRKLLIVLLTLSLTFCATTPPPPAQQTAIFDPAILSAIDTRIETAIAEKRLPGGVLWIERNGEIYKKTYGKRALVPAEEAMTEDTIFDAASLTKVTATTPAIWLLIERGMIGLDDPVSKHIPEFKGGLRDQVTIRHLLTHVSGLAPDPPLDFQWSGYAEGLRLSVIDEPSWKPGLVFRYSDINFILLGEIVHRVSGMSLHEFTQREVFQPLKMNDTGFRSIGKARDLRGREKTDGEQASRLQPAGVSPDGGTSMTLNPADTTRIAPTEQSEIGMLRGVVHDPTSRRMGGVTGHAGLFTTAADLARYARMLLNGGELDGVRVLKPETVKAMTADQSPAGVAIRRTGGFDLDSSYSRPRGLHFPLGSFGHTGWTGGMMWIDPFSNSFYVFLSNRVHPDGRGGVTGLQLQLGTLVAEAVGYDPATKALRNAKAPAARPRYPDRIRWLTGGGSVANGIDVLAGQKYASLKGKRVGLITNHTGIDRSGNPTIDLLRAAPDVNLVALFSPEHGIRGVVDDKFGDETDPVSGLPIYSLYGERRKPSAEHLRGLDVLVFDIQDIGARFYTYISTMLLAMEAAGEAKVKFVVLDRVNPISGEGVEGPLLEGATDFVATHPITIRHAMTIGELAKMFKDEKKIDVELEVVALRGWKRAMWQDEAGLPWINTSPNMRSLTAAGNYPGIGLMESAISVGRGTATPFEVFGAPYIRSEELARELNALALPGMRFHPITFTPTASVFQGQQCGGVRIEIIDRKQLQSTDAGVAIAATIARLYPMDFAADKMHRLLRHRATLDAIRAGRSLAEIRALWSDDLRAFQERRAKYLLY